MTGIRIKLVLTPNLEEMLKSLSPRLDLVVPAGTTVRGILYEAGIPLLAVYNVIHDRAFLQPDDTLAGDAELTLLAPIAGG